MMSEEVMRARTFAAQNGSFITISNFEYEYLTGRASGAEEIADKKVAAAQAWIEALKAGEKEILMRTEVAERETRESRLEEEKEALRAAKSVSGRRAVEGESERKTQDKNSESADMQLAVATPRKSFLENGSIAPIRRAVRIRKGGTGRSRSSSFSGKNRTKGMTNLSLFGSQTAENVG
uniref:Uncharacterized protein n=1 Tax=Kalanchoe fedtschenkoi TaxID=63787 RepID=A0A7N0T8V4_KALFE